MQFGLAFKLIFLSSLVGVSIADDAFQDEIPDRELFSDIDKSLQRFSDSLYAVSLVKQEYVYNHCAITDYSQ